ncbi:hypothetical protein [Alkalibaculum sporogenes]|nr:hypothetical protein [Alkalibaculum sporogenes]
MAAGERQFDFISPDDYTVVTDTGGSNFAITVQGYQYSLPGYDSLTADEKLQMEWSIDEDTDVIDIVSGGTDSDTATFEVKGEGTATINMTYTQPDTTTTSVTTYVVVEGTTVVSQVEDVNVEIVGDTFSGLNDTYDVPLFDLKDVFDGTFEDVLKNTPSATHAVLYALEIENSTETTATPIGSFDWNWVRANVTIDHDGGYISRIEDDEDITIGWDFYGWQYRVNTLDPGRAASVTPLEDDDSVLWFFDVYSW